MRFDKNGKAILREKPKRLFERKTSLPGVEVVGGNVGKPAKKWKTKRSSSSKGLVIIWEDDE